jgi:alkylated DNA repair dioxygenase AlkB
MKRLQPQEDDRNAKRLQSGDREQSRDHVIKPQAWPKDAPFMYSLSCGLNLQDWTLRSGIYSWFSYFRLPENLCINYADFETLWNLHPVERSAIRLYGKTILSPRYTQSFGKDYYYSGAMHPGQPFHPILRDYLDFVNQAFRGMYRFGFQNPFNMCLVNWYEDGSHYIAPHSDDESVMEKNAAGESVVVTISFGQSRLFRLIAKDPNNPDHMNYEMRLEPNTVLVMGGTCQSTHKHTIVKEPKVLGKRISLTFRIFKQ